MARRKVKSMTRGGETVTVYKDTEWGEYVVQLKGHPKADYFTGDKSDALDTAEDMLTRRAGALHGLAGSVRTRRSRSDKVWQQHGHLNDRAVPIKAEIGRRGRAFLACAWVGRTPRTGSWSHIDERRRIRGDRCAAGRNPRKALASALAKLAKAIGGRSGAFAGSR